MSDSNYAEWDWNTFHISGGVYSIDDVIAVDAKYAAHATLDLENGISIEVCGYGETEEEAEESAGQRIDACMKRMTFDGAPLKGMSY